MWACVSTGSIIKIDHPSTTVVFNSKVQEIEKWKYLVWNQNWSSIFIRSSKQAPTATSCSLILLHKMSFLRVLVWKSSKHHRWSLAHMEDEESFVPSSPKLNFFIKISKKKSRSCMQTELTRLLVNKSRAPNRIRFVVEMPREFFRSVKVRPDTLEYLCKVF